MARTLLAYEAQNAASVRRNWGSVRQVKINTANI